MDALGPLVRHPVEQHAAGEQPHVEQLAEHRPRLVRRRVVPLHRVPTPGDAQQQQQHPDRRVVARRHGQEEHQRQAEQEQVVPVAAAQGQQEERQREELQDAPGNDVARDVLLQVSLLGLLLQATGEVEPEGVLEADALAAVGVLLAVVGDVLQEHPPGRDALIRRHRASHEQNARRGDSAHAEPEQFLVDPAVARQEPQPHHQGPEEQQPREHPHHRRVAHEQARAQGPAEPPRGDSGPGRREPVVDPDLADDPAGVAEPGDEGEQDKQGSGPAEGPHAEGEGGEQQERIEQDQQGLLPRHLDVEQPDPGATDGVPGG